MEETLHSTTAQTVTANADTPGVSERTRILVVATLGGGGIHRYAEEQYEHLRNRVDIDLYDMASDPKGSGLIWFVVSFLNSLWAALRFPFERKPDIAHIHTSHSYSFYRASVYVLFVRYVWRRPVILHVHGSSFDEFVETDDPLIARIQSIVFGASDGVIVLSEYWREAIAPHVDPTKIHIVPNAVGVEEYDPQFDHEVPHVVFVSNLVERKGVRELVTALESTLDRVDAPFEVSIAGRGPLSPLVDRLADKRPAVNYLGFVSEAEKRALLDSGSIFVLPAYAEGLPIAMLEGMAGGNAVISTNVGSIPEVITEDNGIIIKPGNADALAEALVSLVESPETAAAMGRTNRRAAEERYAWSSVTESLLTIYDSYLE
jgi:glycosyltransferase involved in cell wall biosynthesis